VGDEARTDPQDEAWKTKVKSLDDTLKSLRSGGDKSKPAKRPEPAKREQNGRGLFSFLQAKPAPIVIPIRTEPAGK
jgi:hypothetical protein